MTTFQARRETAIRETCTLAGCAERAGGFIESSLDATAVLHHLARERGATGLSASIEKNPLVRACARIGEQMRAAGFQNGERWISIGSEAAKGDMASGQNVLVAACDRIAAQMEHRL